VSETSKINTAWKILYGLDFEEIRNPNQPENEPYFKAKRQEKLDAFEYLKKSKASVIFDMWADNIMKNNMAILFTPDSQLCGCTVCSQVRSIRETLGLWVQTETLLKKEKL